MPKIDLGKVVGEDAKITIGTTTTLDAGNDATVENVGTKSDAVLNFGIPKGYTPIKGTDYWTENDIDEIHDYVDEQISAIDLTPYSEKTETGHSIELSIDAQTYVMTATLKNVSGDVLNTQTIDLPLETMVVSGSYDSATKEVVLTLQSGSTIRFSVSDLVDGLVSESDLEVTLADYVSRETFDSIVGDLDDLSTEDKTTIVNAINEVVTNMGDLSIKELQAGTYNIDELDDGIYIQEATRTIKLNLPRRSDGHDQGEEYVQYDLVGILIKASSLTDEPSIMGYYMFTTIDDTNNYVKTIVQGYYEKFEDPAGVEEPIIIGEYETAYNAAKKYTNNVTGDLANLDTTDKTNLVSAINEVASSASEDGVQYLGEIGQYTIDNPLNLNLLNKGVYILTNTSMATQYYISKEYNGNVTKTPITFSTNYWNGHTPIFLKMFTKISDELASDTTVCEFSVQETYNNYGGDARIIETYAPVKLNASVYWYGAAEITPVTINKDQTVTGKKTFSTLPESTIVPTNDNQFTNKKYVDDRTSSAQIYNNTSFEIRTQATGYYLLGSNVGTLGYSGMKSMGRQWGGTSVLQYNVNAQNTFAIIIDKNGKFYVMGYVNKVWRDIEGYLLSEDNQTISGKKTFNTLPEASSVPTTDDQLVNKKYVDDAIASAITTTLGGSY